MRRLSIQVIAALAYTIAAPAFGYAQASIAGTVSDPSGAALPGVTVEVTSSSLIEKTRSVVSDSTGRYRIVELAPGDYSRIRAATLSTSPALGWDTWVPPTILRDTGLSAQDYGTSCSSSS